MKPITTKPGTEILLVEVPKDVRGIRFRFSKFLTYSRFCSSVIERIDIPGKWTFVTLSSEVTEEQARKLVEHIIVRSIVPARATGYHDSITFKNYLKEDQYNNAVFSPIDSLWSAIEASGGKRDKVYAILVRDIPTQQ